MRGQSAQPTATHLLLCAGGPAPPHLLAAARALQRRLGLRRRERVSGQERLGHAVLCPCGQRRRGRRGRLPRGRRDLGGPRRADRLPPRAGLRLRCRVCKFDSKTWVDENMLGFGIVVKLNYDRNSLDLQFQRYQKTLLTY